MTLNQIAKTALVASSKQYVDFPFASKLEAFEHAMMFARESQVVSTPFCNGETWYVKLDRSEVEKAFMRHRTDGHVASLLDVMGLYENQPNQRAVDISNGRLIAAAPELLKACKAMRDRLTVMANESDHCWRDWDGAYDVDTAIAKAEGREA